MAWENIEARLAKAFSIRLSFPGGMVMLPASHLDIDEWLLSAAETDEELSELNIPRFRFLQNRWPIEKLVQFDWENETSFSRLALYAMYLESRAYVLCTAGFRYQLIAAIEPRNEPALYRAVIRRVLQDPDFVPTPPTHIKIVRPGLIPELAGNVDDALQSSKLPVRNGYVSNLLVGWIGPWVDLPVLGYWHEDEG
jgi:hypothetical protein